MESAIGKSPDVHYIYVCIKVCCLMLAKMMFLCLHLVFISWVTSPSFKLAMSLFIWKTVLIFRMRRWRRRQRQFWSHENLFLVLFASEHIGPYKELSFFFVVFMCKSKDTMISWVHVYSIIRGGRVWFKLKYIELETKIINVMNSLKLLLHLQSSFIKANHAALC